FGRRPRWGNQPRVFPSRAREETRESRGMACLFLNTERVFGQKTTQKSGFRRHLAGSKMPKEGSKMPKETFSVSIRRGPRKDIPRGRPSGRHGTILPPAVAGKGRGGALMRDLCCYAVILRRRWMTRRFAGTGSFEKRDHERPDNSPT